eukprot:CAMPEP_0196739824 /NCGR_PEP_ID=MMETSP1091-20130531/26402_1 /TAXON_ID=302021 /ORGANISM="Rhodomonas sp., Strain CCMP768" /LENGTH=134 /DNA_ID=CAMNT_0042084607 /DNA_START=12 /DNA_END=416 /DNA_ORIENTATION=+
MQVHPRALAATLAMAAAFLLALSATSSVLKPSRSMLIQQKLAYDGPYDTPPVTWYYPANTGTYFTGENKLGYEWNDVEYQWPSVTYEPGVMTDRGIASTTADTIGYDTGPTTAAYPLGLGGDEGNVIYQDYGER